MLTRPLLKASAVSVGLLLSAAAAGAQMTFDPSALPTSGFQSTGSATLPSNSSLDANWFVAWCQVTAGAGSACVGTPQTISTNQLGNASLLNSSLVSSIAPTWYPDGGTNWIGVNPDGTLPGGNGVGAVQYRYLYFTEFTTPVNSITLGYNGDNFFRGYTVGNVGNASDFFNDLMGVYASGVSLPGDDGQTNSAFCNNNRTDGIVGPPCPQLATVNITGLDTQGPNIVAFELEGDGTTDGFYATTTTPEPSSMALLGTGLIGLVPMIRRRKKA